MNANQVNEIYSAYYADLREATGENAPSSYVYFAATGEEVAEESGHEFDGDFQDHLGNESSPVVAVALDCHLHDWHAIHADATPEQVRQFFEDCGGTIDQPIPDSDFRLVCKYSFDAWQIHDKNGTIETSDDYDSDHQELCDAVGLDSEDTESWSCEIMGFDPIHELLKVGDRVVCGGYGETVYVLRCGN